MGMTSGTNVTTGNFNTCLGYNAGANITTTSDNTFLGSNSNATAGITNGTAVGANANVTTSNTIQLGDSNVSRVNTTGLISSAHLFWEGVFTIASSSFTVPVASSVIAVPFDSFNNNLVTSPSTGGFTVPANASGRYMIMINYYFNQSTNFNIHSVVRVNGGDAANRTFTGITGSSGTASSGVTSNYRIRASNVISLAAGDVVQFYLNTTNGSAGTATILSGGSFGGAQSYAYVYRIC